MTAPAARDADRKTPTRPGQGGRRRLWLWLAMPPLGLAIVLAALVALSHAMPLNFLRPTAEAMLADALNRPVALSGDLWIRIGRSVRLVAKGLDVDNPPGSGFPKEDFLTARRVSIDIPLWTLLTGEPRIVRLAAAGGNLQFQVRADGVNNWNLAEASDTRTERSIGLPQTLRIKDGRIGLIDIPAQQESAIEKLEVHLTPLPPEGGSVAAAAVLQPGWEVKAEGLVQGRTVTLTGRQSAELRNGVYDLQLDLQSELVTSGLQGRVYEGPLPGFDGKVEARIPAVRDAAEWLQIPLDLTTPDPGSLSFAATLGADGTRSVLKEATLTGGQAKGRAEGSLQRTAAGLQLAGAADFDLLDLNPYMPPPDVETVMPTPISNLAIFLTIREIAELPDTPVPLDWLDSLAGGYGLRIDRLVLQELEIRKAEACLAMKDGTARLALVEDTRTPAEASDAAAQERGPAGNCSAVAARAVARPVDLAAPAEGTKPPASGDAAEIRQSGDGGATGAAESSNPPAGTGHLILALRRAAAAEAPAPDGAAGSGHPEAGGVAPPPGSPAQVTLEVATNAMPIGRVDLLLSPPPVANAKGRKGSAGAVIPADGPMAYLTGTAALHTVGVTWLRLAAHIEGNVQAGLSTNPKADAEPSLVVDMAAPTNGEPLTAKLKLQDRGMELGLDVTASPVRQILLDDSFSLKSELTGALASGTVDGVVQTRPVPAFRGKAALKTDRPGPLAALLTGDPGLKDYRPGALSLSLSVAEKGKALEIETASLDIGESHFEASGSIVPQTPVAANLAITGSKIDLARLMPPSAPGRKTTKSVLPEMPASDLFTKDLKLDLTARLTEVTGAGLTLDAVDLQGKVGPGLWRLTGSGTPVGGGSLSLDLSLTDNAGTAEAVGSLDLQGQQVGRILGAGAVTGGSGTLRVSASAAGRNLATLADSLTGKARLDVKDVRIPDTIVLDSLAADLQAGTGQTSLTATARFPKPKLGADDAIAIVSKESGEIAVTHNPVKGELICKARLWNCLVADEMQAALTLDSGGSRLAFDGKAALRADPLRLSGRLNLAGKRLSDWDAAVGDPLPQYGPYSLTAEVSGTPAKHDFRKLKLKVASSDLSGRAGVHWQDGHVTLDAELSSQRLDTEDFGSSNVAGQTFAEKVRIPTDWLAWLRGKAILRIAQLVAQPGIDLTDVTTSLTSNGKRLQVERFQAAVMKGRVDLQGSLAGAPGDAAAIGVKGNLKGGDLTALAAHLGKPDVVSGVMDAVVDVKGQGSTLDEIVHRPTGTFFLQIDKGHISNDLLGIMSVKLVDVFGPLFGSSDTTKLQCLQASGTARDGVVDLPSILVDTSIFAVTGKGKVDLPKENVDMDFRIFGQRISVSSLAPAFSVVGPLGNPSISFDVGKTALDLAPSLLSSLAGEVANIVKGVTGAGGNAGLQACPPPKGVSAGG